MTLFEPHEPAAAPGSPLVRVRMTVAYLGTPFAGMAENPGVRTVAGTLRAALERVLRHGVHLTVAGRTDAGVHAQGQVVSFDARDGVDLVALQRALNGLCGPDIAVRDLALADPAFDARFSARARRYRYSILNRPVRDPLTASTTWWVPGELDLAAMVLACDPLIGEHDFASFCRRPAPDASLVRRVLDARWHDLGDGRLRFDIEATAFCQQMVRSIVGTLVDVGLGRRLAGEVGAILRARDRAAAGPVAPPHGLVLWEVVY